MPRPLALPFALALVFTIRPAAAGDAPAADAENPRNVRFEGPVVETVRATPRVQVGATGDSSVWPPDTEVRFEAVTRVLPAAGAGAAGTPPAPEEPPRFTIDGRAKEPLRSPEGPYVPWRAEEGRHVLEVSWGQDRGEFATDALRVLLLVERKTYDDGEKRFGSFVRRFRKSLDDLHALFAASVHPAAPKGILDRFRIDEVRVYDREAGKPPPGFLDHPEADVAIACDEGGPSGGFVLPAHSIEHGFVGTPEHKGLWSSWGERSLWLDLLRYRGVPDLSRWVIEGGALPGRFAREIPLPARFAKDLAGWPPRAPVLSEYTAVVANLRHGVARVGECENPENVRFGHVWNFLPGRLAVALQDKAGAPLSGAKVRWWRSRPVLRAGDDPLAGVVRDHVAGIEADRAPDGEGTADEKGVVTIAGDYLGRADRRERRSRWMLVEVTKGEERRFEIVYALDLHLAYVRGAKYVHTVPWTFEDLIPVGAPSLPKGR
jgi:hypothetical protein